MRTKSNSLSLMTVFICGFVLLALHLAANQSDDKQFVAPGSGPVHLLRPGKAIKSVDEIKAAFQKNDFPIDFEEVSGKNAPLFFVAMHPYSGVRGVDLLCYVNRGAYWDLCNVSYIRWVEPGALKYKVDGDFVNVLNGDDVILKLNPKPGKN